MTGTLAVLLVVGAAACGGDGPPVSPTPSDPPAPWSGGRVRLLYLIPTDRTFRTDYAEAVAQAFQDLRSWYASQLGGKTFWLAGAQPEPCSLPAADDYYAVDSWTKVMTDVQACAPVSYNSPEFVWVLYADVVHACDAPGRLGAATSGVAILGKEDLEGLTGHQVISCTGRDVTATLGRWIGGAGHELGHALGLKHPPGCNEGLPTCDRNALMWLGYTTYPNTYLREDDKPILLASPFIG